MKDVLGLLERQDKWFLGGAPGLLYAPPAPIWLDYPGFWDAAHYLHFPIEPVFTFALLDEHLRPIALTAEGRSWRPDRLEQVYSAPGLRLYETRVCGPHDVLSSIVRIENTGGTRRQLRLLAWTSQPVDDKALLAAGRADGHVFVRREVQGLRDTRLPVTLALGLQGARSSNVHLSEATANQPHFHLTPYYETLGEGGLDGQVILSGVDRSGLVYAALERPVLLPADEVETFKVAACTAPETEDALQQLGTALTSDVVAASTRAWQAYFGSVPQFACSDPHITTYYWYRWFGLRLNTLATQLGNYRYPAVAEGIGYFRVPISYSAQCHMLETRWMHAPALAQGSLLNFVHNQRADGSFPGHIHANYVAPEGIYHADWGQRTLDVFYVHPDPAFLEAVYPALGRYAEYFYRERDPQGSGLYDHVNQWESGQEYMSRYVWVDGEGDEWRAMKRRLKGLDASLYIYRLERALAEMSRRLGRGQEELWTGRALRTKQAILEHCWDEELQAFVDVSPELERSGLVFALSFYPFFTDLVTEKHLPSLARHLFNEASFWTAFPVPASPKTDPYYSAIPAWKGKRTNCPWNGRMWPMTNSHVAEAIAGASRLEPALRERAAEFIVRFVRTMFYDGDVARPNCFEHYNPETGRASVYRGIDDYQHSWVVDLIIKYVAGLQPEADGVVIDPFPFDISSFELRDARVHGRRIDIVKTPEQFAVFLDGTEVHSSAAPEKLELKL